jgi:hypothetical protein
MMVSTPCEKVRVPDCVVAIPAEFNPYAVQLTSFVTSRPGCHAELRAFNRSFKEEVHDFRAVNELVVRGETLDTRVNPAFGRIYGHDDTFTRWNRISGLVKRPRVRKKQVILISSDVLVECCSERLGSGIKSSVHDDGVIAGGFIRTA